MTEITNLSIDIVIEELEQKIARKGFTGSVKFTRKHWQTVRAFGQKNGSCT